MKFVTTLEPDEGHMNDPAWKMALYSWVGPTNASVRSEWIEAHDNAAQSGRVAARQIFGQDTLDQRMNDRCTWIDVDPAKNF